MWSKIPSGWSVKEDLCLQSTVREPRADGACVLTLPLFLGPSCPRAIKRPFLELAHFSLEYNLATCYELSTCTRSLTLISLFQSHKRLPKYVFWSLFYIVQPREGWLSQVKRHRKSWDSSPGLSATSPYHHHIKQKNKKKKKNLKIIKIYS